MKRVTCLAAMAAVALTLGSGPAKAQLVTTNYGFLYNGTTYTAIAPPGATSTVPTGVSGGDVVGFYDTNAGTSYGFLYNGTTYTTLAVPGATSTFALKVSGGDVVGYYDTSAGTSYGFLYNGTTYTTLAIPGATSTQALGISGGNVVGDYSNALIGGGIAPVPAIMRLLRSSASL